MDELELIIKKIEDNIDSDDFEWIMDECILIFPHKTKFFLLDVC